MKTVFKSDEIAHLWANRGAPYGRSPSNMSFDGDAFKSYGTVIGRRITARGRVAYVLDRASFSISTSKSQGAVRAAIRDAEKVFFVRCGERGQSLAFTPASLRDRYLADFREMGDTPPPRMKAKQAEALLHRFSRLESAIDVCAYFNLPAKKLTALLAKSAPDLTDARTLADEYRGNLWAKREIRWEADRKERERRDAARITKAITMAEAICEDRQPFTGKEDFGYSWHGDKFPMLDSRPELRAMIGRKAEEFEATKLVRWQAGEDVSLPRDVPTMLRAEGDGMVTSHGARVPLADARRTYRFAMICKAKGWHRNGETHSIGAYQLDAVNENGVVAGCHRVSWSEIGRFAALQGWVKAST